MRTLAILLLLGLAGGLGVWGLLGKTWLMLPPALIVGAVLHAMIWGEDIAAEFRRGHFAQPLLPWARDLVGLAAAYGVGRLLAALSLGEI